MAAAAVKRAWMKVPRMSQARVLLPMRSPMRPKNAPPRKVRTETRACRSARRKEKSVVEGAKRRASASASWELKAVSEWICWEGADTHLDGVTGLETAPYEDCGERYSVTGKQV
jgi:hypothetical protein